MHVGFTVTSPPAHRGLYGCAPVAFASEESFPPGITTAQLVEADELYLSQLNLLRPNASGAFRLAKDFEYRGHFPCSASAPPVGVGRA